MKLKKLWNWLFPKSPEIKGFIDPRVKSNNIGQNVFLYNVKAHEDTMFYNGTCIINMDEDPLYIPRYMVVFPPTVDNFFSQKTLGEERGIYIIGYNTRDPLYLLLIVSSKGHEFRIVHYNELGKYNKYLKEFATDWKAKMYN